MQFDETLRYLLSLGHETSAIKLGLANTEALLDALACAPENSRAVQIAGTNGKGSTAAMLEAIARDAGIKTGLYTSPHLVSITERIRIGGAEITRDEFARLATRVRAASVEVERTTGSLPTFFEQVTAAAMLAFKEARVELWIIETGLGGHLDATTAARSRFAAISPIALDHQEYLGHTLAEIAAQKAAIIRRGLTLAACLAPQLPEAEEVLRRYCADAGLEPRFATRDIRVEDTCDANGRLRVTFTTRRATYERVCLSLRGRHQITNASLAVELAETLGEHGLPLAHANIVAGLERAVHAGRLELRAGVPPILFDGAHNTAGARALRDYLDEFVRAPVTFVFGAMRDKEISKMAGILFSPGDRLILTRPDNPRAATPDELLRALPFSLNSSTITRAPSVAGALHVARALAPPRGLICITGSLYLVGEAKGLLDSPEQKNGSDGDEGGERASLKI
ncbi:MAG TPA: Mur ligase family protein [Pyrinomonadaceae bacterium]|jgi:dihydrofolate synthase/folylpolyglutamate synthase|nr:Mur ligase family protein [Pyrinomonadaceae bacterium]